MTIHALIARYREWRDRRLQYKLVLANEILERTASHILVTRNRMSAAGYYAATGIYHSLRRDFKYYESLDRRWRTKRRTFLRKLGLSEIEGRTYTWHRFLNLSEGTALKELLVFDLKHLHLQP